MSKTTMAILVGVVLLAAVVLLATAKTESAVVSSSVVTTIAADAGSADAGLADDSGQAAHRETKPKARNPHKRSDAAGLACSVCHSCDEPSIEDPCLDPCPRHGGRFVGDHEVDDGPEVVVIDLLSELYQPVVFAHKLHAGMADMSGGCTNCHHYSEDSGTVPPCRECHNTEKELADLRMPSLKGAYHRQCINCHLDWTHKNACSSCHEPIDPEMAHADVDSTHLIGVPHPKIEATDTYFYEVDSEEGPIVSFHHNAHVELFGNQCVDCHKGNSCAHCHDQAAPPGTHKLDHVAECGTCHEDRDCAYCHSDKQRPIFNHEFAGFLLNEDHEDADCIDCHMDKNFKESLTCLECHDDEMYPDELPGEL